MKKGCTNMNSLLLELRAIWTTAIIGCVILAGASPSVQAGEELTVYHPPVTTKLSTQGSDGHQLGDLRVTSIPVTDAEGKAIGRLDATLVTTAIETPSPGDEIRISELVFTLDTADAIIVGGSGIYPKQLSTLQAGTSLVRPITGASGRFAGLTGWCESVHLEDGRWTHTFHFAKLQ